MILNPYNSIYSEYVSNKIHHKREEQSADDDHHKEGQYNQNNKKINTHHKENLSNVEDKTKDNEIKKMIGLGYKLDIRV